MALVPGAQSLKWLEEYRSASSGLASIILLTGQGYCPLQRSQTTPPWTVLRAALGLEELLPLSGRTSSHSQNSTGL